MKNGEVLIIGGAALLGSILLLRSQTKPPEDSTPVSAFTPSVYSGVAPLTVSFTNLSTGDITGYQWLFGDGTTSTERNPTHTFATPKVYSVRLAAIGPGGTSYASAHITVSAAVIAPVASFTISTSSGNIPLSVQFTDKSTGTIERYLWEFGDGVTSAEQNPQHMYSVPGTYSPKLTVTGPLGESEAILPITAILPVPETTTLLSPGTTSPPGEWMPNPVPADIVFSWNPVYLAENYELWIEDITDPLHTFLFTYTTQDTYLTISSTIVAGREYRWWIVSGNASGSSPESPPLYFNSLSGTPATLTLRPNGAGYYTQLVPFSAVTNWECVAPAIPHPGRFVEFWNYGYTWDTYALSDHTSEVGVIQKVTIYAVCSKEVGAGEVYGSLRIRISGMDTDSSEFSLTDVRTLYSAEFSNPLGGEWSWADIDALEAGFGERSPVWAAGKCHQLYVKVDYLL
jgi:hypothetical protein